MNPDIKRILIVDDSPEDVVLTSSALAENNLANEIIIAEDGLEALDYLHKRGKFANVNGLPAVILLDIKMPGDDGVTILKKIKSVDPTAAVILMTAYPSDDTITQALNSGAYDYILKPFNIEKIQFLIERAISYHKLLKGSGKISKKP